MNLKTHLQNLFQSMERRNRYNKDRSTLTRMSDRELADLGISRLDIPKLTDPKRK